MLLLFSKQKIQFLPLHRCTLLILPLKTTRSAWNISPTTDLSINRLQGESTASHLQRWSREVCLSGFMPSAPAMSFKQRCVFEGHTRAGWATPDLMRLLTGPSHLIISPITEMKSWTFFFLTNGASRNRWRATQVMCARLKCVFHGRLARLAQIAHNKAVYDADRERRMGLYWGG